MKKLKSSSTSLNVSAIITHFGGPAELVRLLKHHEIIELTTFALDKWRARGHIPHARLDDLVRLGSKARKRLDLKNFRKVA